MPDPASNGNGRHELELAQPKHGTRGTEPGPRGCWAIKHSGEPCGAAARRGQDFCGAHLGLGVAADPRRYQPLATAAAKANAGRRAQLRASLGLTRRHSTRDLLKAEVFRERERVVAAAMSPIRDSGLGSVARHRAALELLETVEPVTKIELDVELPVDEQGVERLS